ncbi:MAG: DUF2520 domain-containing protein [Acidimicrobiia bacterium]
MGVDLLVLAVPDGAIAGVAGAVEPAGGTVVAHVAGAVGLEALEPHYRRAGVHPLMALPDGERGAELLLGGGWFGVAGDPMAGEVVAALGGRSFAVAEEQRTLYHAAAVIASNHLVGLLGQAERIASAVGVPFEAYLDLALGALGNVALRGPAAALTGPAARGDEATIERHLGALPPDERDAYAAMADQCRRLAR